MYYCALSNQFDRRRAITLSMNYVNYIVINTKPNYIESKLWQRCSSKRSLWTCVKV